MKNAIPFMLICLLLGSSAGFAQQAYELDLTKNRHIKAVASNVAYPVQQVGEILIPFADPVYPTESRSGGGPIYGTIIGSSTYDLMTNNTTKQRLYLENGNTGAIWTGSTAVDMAWADRGAFYNYNDGTGWGAPPTARIEAVRTGWPVIVNSMGDDLVFSHDFAGDGYILMYRSPEGGSSWVEEISDPTVLVGIWPNVATDPTSNIIHLTTSDYQGGNGPNNTFYYRSIDNGTTWDIQGYTLPGIDTVNGIIAMGADNTNIAVDGSKVAIVSANSNNDLQVWISTSNGDTGTWVKTRILDFPFDNFNGNELTDLDGDGAADQVETTDGSHSVLIDNSGMVHVWSGAMLIIDDTPGDDAWSYFPGTSGMWYWNESYGPDSVMYMNPLVDWDCSGDPLDGIGASVPLYNTGLTSQMAAALDETSGIIYLVWPGLVEGSDFFGDPTNALAQSFRDLHGMYTTDGGATWSQPVNLTRDAGEFFESTYPMIHSKTVNNQVHVTYMRDEEPGNVLSGDGDPVGDNQIVYAGIDYARFEPYNPTAGFTFAVSGGTVDFTNTSTDAVKYVWDLGDGTLNSLENPTYTYASSGTYTVCLEAGNIYGTDSVCEQITVMVSGLEDPALAFASVYPNPANEMTLLDLGTFNNATLEISVMDMFGRTLEQISWNNGMSSKIEISTVEYPAGTYFVKMMTENGQSVRKFNVSH